MVRIHYPNIQGCATNSMAEATCKDFTNVIKLKAADALCIGCQHSNSVIISFQGPATVMNALKSDPSGYLRVQGYNTDGASEFDRGYDAASSMFASMSVFVASALALAVAKSI